MEIDIFKIIAYAILILVPTLIIFFVWLFLKMIRTPTSFFGKSSVLLIEVPKNNEKSPLAAEQMFAALHGILRSAQELAKGIPQEHISFEIVSIEKFIRFYVWVPEHLKDFVESQIYAQYPTVEIHEVEDYTRDTKIENLNMAGTQLILNKSDVYPIKTFPNFEVDPLAAITSTLSKTQTNEQIWLQLLIKPIGDYWQSKSMRYVNAIKAGQSPEFSLGALIIKNIINIGSELIKAFLATPSQKPTSTAQVKLPGPIETAIKGIENKATKLGFSSVIRIICFSKDIFSAKSRLQSVVGTFKQFNTTNLNGFSSGNIFENDKNFVEAYKNRYFPPTGSYIFNIEELASIYHLPNISVETPNIVWAGSKKGEPPANLPVVGSVPKEELTPFAETDFRHIRQKFGIKTDDRRRHMYIIGKTGTGKTTMMENMIISDMRAGRGVGVVDPHGDFINMILNHVPSYRINDVVIFDPADRENPVAFNLLEEVNPDLRGLIASGLISIFQKIWASSWGPRLEYILRNTILALLEYPNSTMLGITRMLTDNEYRNRVVAKITDPVVKDFWVKEYAEYDKKFRTEAIAPIQNKVGQFLSTPTIRNIVGQPHSTIDIKNIMDTKKILLVKLAQGEIGEDNSALLGAMIITKIQLCAMARATIPEEERVDFYLYVDEFQNFATESFAKILSEARKYRLNLIIANQYIAQMPEAVTKAVFGNVGTIVSFRVGADDAKYLVKEYEPVFDEVDLVNLDKYHIYLKLSIDGITTPAFSAVTLPPPTQKNQNAPKILKLSRERYSRPRSFVEQKIAEWALEKPAEKPEKLKEKLTEKIEEKPAQKIEEKIAEKKIEKVEKPKVEKPLLRYKDYSEEYKAYLEKIRRQILASRKSNIRPFSSAILPKIIDQRKERETRRKSIVEQKANSEIIEKELKNNEEVHFE